MPFDILACVPFGAPAYTPGPDFVLIECDCCKNSMWIGPKQKQKKETEHIEAFCMYCLFEKFGNVQDKVKPLGK